MKITNTTKSDIGLDHAHVVPAGGSVEIDNDKLTKFKSLPSVKAHFVEKRLIEDGPVREGKKSAPKAQAKPKAKPKTEGEG